MKSAIDYQLKTLLIYYQITTTLYGVVSAQDTTHLLSQHYVMYKHPRPLLTTTVQYYTAQEHAPTDTLILSGLNLPQYYTAQDYAPTELYPFRPEFTTVLHSARLCSH